MLPRVSFKNSKNQIGVVIEAGSAENFESHSGPNKTQHVLCRCIILLVITFCCAVTALCIASVVTVNDGRMLRPDVTNDDRKVGL
jgi:hypothetical protein